ncbi:MAG TPA: hypothetical protein VE548_10475 [Nitrososphaeraceae archaeon]|nr:hypothetical protein [Nitrososphaeraceae archaeon]
MKKIYIIAIISNLPIIIFIDNIILEVTSRSMLVIPDVRPVFVTAETDSKKVSKKLVPLKEDL